MKDMKELRELSLHGKLIKIFVEEFIANGDGDLSILGGLLQSIFKFDTSVSYDSSNNTHIIRIQFINYDGRENELTVTVINTLRMGSTVEKHL